MIFNAKALEQSWKKTYMLQFLISMIFNGVLEKYGKDWDDFELQFLISMIFNGTRTLEEQLENKASILNKYDI